MRHQVKNFVARFIKLVKSCALRHKLYLNVSDTVKQYTPAISIEIATRFRAFFSRSLQFVVDEKGEINALSHCHVKVLAKGHPTFQKRLHPTPKVYLQVCSKKETIKNQKHKVRLKRQKPNIEPTKRN